MDHNNTGCQPPPEHTILCINNCGFFGSASTMNMCSKCHKDVLSKQEQAKLAASSIESLVSGASNTMRIESAVTTVVNLQQDIIVEPTPIAVQVQPSFTSGAGESVESKPKQGPNRCNSCKKRIGLTGFKCRCGDLFCSTHRYSDKHDCPFDYRSAARDAIAQANPVVKSEKLDKI